MRLTRRKFIQATGIAGISIASAPSIALGKSATPIDRKAVVSRHNPVVTKFDPFSALSVGNGEFAFTVDLTGLQTFNALCEKEFPLCTLSHWGWHTNPAPDGVSRANLRLKEFNVRGRKIGYATDKTGQEKLFDWLRENPHRMHLGRIAFEFQKNGGSQVSPEDLTDNRQTLDLWTGVIDSRFAFERQPVYVQTCAHPTLDLVAVRVESPLLASGKLKVLLAFPNASPEMSAADWQNPDRHSTILGRDGGQRATFARALDKDSYSAAMEWSRQGSLTQKSAHQFLLASDSGSLEFICCFAAKPISETLPGFGAARDASANGWQKFWTNGGAIDLDGSTDSRAGELERRMVLSLYNTALHSAGSLPPAEAGLLCNTWYGKFHLEMHWWHGVHFAAWNRHALFERSLGYYQRILPVARDIAKNQGYRGARWPKMVGPDGLDSPSPVGPLLIWQQPHPIYYAELCYLKSPTKETLARWRDVVFESAEFMADYPAPDPEQDRLILGPPIKCVPENNDTNKTINPAFELAYWRFGLSTALLWCERLGAPKPAKWAEVLKKLSPLPMADGLYLMSETQPDTYTKWNWEHPSVLGPLGMQPGFGVDAAVMKKTARKVFEAWQWDRSWGWDFPMTAMAAARSGDPELALDFLMLDAPKNRYLLNGHNYQRENLPAYLPGNGGLLQTMALMAGGWTNGPDTDAPGFPTNGKWKVRHEDLKKCI
jgi:hypothetical protein